jgi:hypothetical protein
MFFFKKILFKLMELGLGIRTCFSLDTRNPIFLNFRLSAAEAEAVRRTLPAGFRLEPMRFAEGDAAPEYWLSYNLYEIRYPKKELSAIRKVRCEINTYVRDPKGRRGIYVFCGSPFVSRETGAGVVGKICDLAERLVIFIYGCGRLVSLEYSVGDRLRIALAQGDHRVDLDQPLEPAGAAAMTRLSDEYHVFNDISFFNRGATFDLVNVTSSYLTARFQRIDGAALRGCRIRGPFFDRAPDCAYLHRGSISYFVSSMNRLGVSPMAEAL